MHDYNLRNNYGKNIKDYLEKNYLPIPYHWKEKDMDIFD